MFFDLEQAMSLQWGLSAVVDRHTLQPINVNPINIYWVYYHRHMHTHIISLKTRETRVPRVYRLLLNDRPVVCYCPSFHKIHELKALSPRQQHAVTSKHVASNG